MDYAALLRSETQTSHANFHQYLLALSKSSTNALFFFYEGEEDPVFYTGHIIQRIGDKDYHTFVCNGRTEVLHTNSLILRDGRANDRCTYFIDKDHTDIISKAEELPRNFFQTSTYSFENYLVCEQLFRRYWVERLHLPSTDARYDGYLSMFKSLHCSFLRRMRLLMAIVLIGRGVEGHAKVKLNLNNVNLDRVIKLDIDSHACTYVAKAASHFLAASNFSESNRTIRGEELRRVYRKYLHRCDPKAFVRGKHELWFLWKFLTMLGQRLSERAAAKQSGMKRATPNGQLSFENCVEALASLAPCPKDLAEFLNVRFSLV